MHTDEPPTISALIGALIGPLHKVKEVAEALRLHKSSVYRLVEQERLKAIRTGPGGGGIRITHASLVEFVNGLMGEISETTKETSKETV
jgi:excisionase family DNA binding protein